jgi:hypothetical protein
MRWPLCTTVDVAKDWWEGKAIRVRGQQATKEALRM